MKKGTCRKVCAFAVVMLFLGLTTTVTINAKMTKSDDEAYDLLIITPRNFAPFLQPLVNHKNNLGVSTHLATLDEVYKENGRDEAEKIKYYIKKELDESSIEYVLLVGGRKKPFSFSEEWWLPVRYSFVEDRWSGSPDYYDEPKFISDLYFADIYDSEGNFSSWDTDGDGIYAEWFDNNTAEDIEDLYPDVYLGRLPCRNIFEVWIMVKKIINYEKEKCDDTWFKNVVLVAGDTYTNNDYYEGEFYAQLVLENMSGFNHIKLWTSMGTLTDQIDVINAINYGCGFLFLAGHGSTATWSTHPPKDGNTWITGLHVDSMPYLRNKEKLPICVVSGCHNSMFNNTFFHTSWTGKSLGKECWSWRLTRKIGGGSIATIGNTALGYGPVDKLDPSAGGGGAHLSVYFFEEYGQNGTDILGKAWGNAINTYLKNHPIKWNENSFNDTTIDVKTVQEWVLIGDPSLKIGGYP